MAVRHCERSEAIQSREVMDCFVATLLAMTLSEALPILRLTEPEASTGA
jgi:hypothetical protein